MNAFQFTSSLIRSITWPVAICFLVLFFRKPLSRVIDAITNLISRVNKGAGPGFKFEAEATQFESQIAEINREAPSEPAEVDRRIPSHLITLLSSSPRVAVQEGWKEAALPLRALASTKGLQQEGKDFSALINQFLDAKILNATGKKIFEKVNRVKEISDNLDDTSLENQGARLLDVQNEFRVTIQTRGIKLID